MSIEEQRRAMFEGVYAKPSGVQWNKPCQEYQETWEELGDDRLEAINDYNMMFRVWRKALDSVVIELTHVPVLKVDGSGVDGIDCAYLQRDSVLASIEAAGLKVKP